MMYFYPSLLICVPFTLAYFLWVSSYSLNDEVYVGYPLLISFIAIIIIDFLHFRKRNNYKENISFNYKNISVLLCLFIVAVGILDLVVRGVIIFDVSRYATFSATEAWIRHFSSLCWILVPITIFFKLKKYLAIPLIAWSFLFPVLVVDRNRLLMAFVSIVTSYVFLNSFSSKKFKKIFLLASVAIIFAVGSFVVIGQKRTNENFHNHIYNQVGAPIKLDQKCDLPEHLPVKESFKSLNSSMQWIFLYSTTPIYNLSVQFKCKIKDTTILKAQVIPLWKKYNSVGAPYLVAASQNVGTELLPFYMFFGSSFGIFLSIFLVYGVLKYFQVKFLEHQNIFNFLILLRMSYCALFLGFAPQFFTWTNLGFVIFIKTIEKLLTLPVIRRFQFINSDFSKSV